MYTMKKILSALTHHHNERNEQAIINAATNINTISAPEKARQDFLNFINNPNAVYAAMEAKQREADQSSIEYLRNGFNQQIKQLKQDKGVVRDVLKVWQNKVDILRALPYCHVDAELVNANIESKGKIEIKLAEMFGTALGHYVNSLKLLELRNSARHFFDSLLKKAEEKKSQHNLTKPQIDGVILNHICQPVVQGLQTYLSYLNHTKTFLQNYIKRINTLPGNSDTILVTNEINYAKHLLSNLPLITKADVDITQFLEKMQQYSDILNSYQPIEISVPNQNTNQNVMSTPYQSNNQNVLTAHQLSQMYSEVEPQRTRFSP